MLEVTRSIIEIVDKAIEEDLIMGDPTSDILISEDISSKGAIVARSHGILAGVDLAIRVFSRVGQDLEFNLLLKDGSALEPQDTIFEVQGSARSILQAERVALNFIQHLSGIATETAKYVKAVEEFESTIIDTRKTIPGLRSLAKYAVRVGGGQNHRHNLGDGVLIKDNHIVANSQRGISLGDTVKLALLKRKHTLKVEVEVTNVSEAKEALDAGAEIILVDNMGIDDMKEVVSLAKGKAVVEASGGITLETVKSVASVGVDLISVGALTHSVKAVDISLDLEIE